VDEGKCKAIGLSDIGLERLKEIYEAATIKPAVVHVESHPYLPEWELLESCHENGIVFQAFAALGHSSEPRLPDDPVISSIAKRVNKTLPKCCSPGRCNAGLPSLPHPRPQAASRRTLISPRFLKTR
jgi:diketogulonate reductase-like aldo/keto reductase